MALLHELIDRYAVEFGLNPLNKKVIDLWDETIATLLPAYRSVHPNILSRNKSIVLIPVELVSVAKGKIYLTAASPLLHQELDLRKQELINLLNQKLGEPYINELVWVTRELTEKRNSKLTPTNKGNKGRRGVPR